MAIYIITKVGNGKYRFTLKENGKILLKSRCYFRKADCIDAIQPVRDNAEHFERYFIFNLFGNICGFGLSDQQGNALVLHTICKSISILNKRFNLTMQLAPHAQVVDHTG